MPLKETDPRWQWLENHLDGRPGDRGPPTNNLVFLNEVIAIAITGATQLSREVPARIRTRFHNWRDNDSWSWIISELDEGEEYGDFKYPPHLPGDWDAIIDKAYAWKVPSRPPSDEKRLTDAEILRMLAIMFHDC